MKRTLLKHWSLVLLIILALAMPLISFGSPSFKLMNSDTLYGMFKTVSGRGSDAITAVEYGDIRLLNSCGAPLFVPNNTAAEWSAFLNNLPSCVTKASCGDAICQATHETYSNCSSDCAPVCGDGVCAGEDCITCTADCGICCGNGVCDNRNVNSLSCYLSTEGCPLNSPGYFCSINIVNGLPNGYYNHCSQDCSGSYCETCNGCAADCGSCCGDGFCNESAGEDYTTCSADCTDYCGNGICGSAENCNTCTDDCGLCCGNCFCDYGETRITCSKDCTPIGYCGDGSCSCPICDPDCAVCQDCESSYNCPEDCGVCGDGFCDSNETKATCYTDCGAPVVCPYCPPYENCDPCEALR